MRITIDIPNTSVCAVMSCVYVDDMGNNTIAMRTANAEELRSGKVIIMPSKKKEETDG